MNRLRRSPAAALLVMAALVLPALSQAQRARNYNPATEATVSGSVDKVTDVARGGAWHGLHLTLKSGEKTYDVDVGPAAYVESKGFTFAVGDQIEVLGSTVTLNSAEALIAREIHKDGKVLTLRDSSGIPLWAGQRWR